VGERVGPRIEAYLAIHGAFRIVLTDTDDYWASELCYANSEQGPVEQGLLQNIRWPFAPPDLEREEFVMAIRASRSVEEKNRRSPQEPISQTARPFAFSDSGYAGGAVPMIDNPLSA
jgi:hypothetical protein